MKAEGVKSFLKKAIILLKKSLFINTINYNSFDKKTPEAV